MDHSHIDSVDSLWIGRFLQNLTLLLIGVESVPSTTRNTHRLLEIEVWIGRWTVHALVGDLVVIGL